MKKCNLDCEYQEEGICVVDECVSGFKPEMCKAKSNDDLVSVDELEELGILDW